MVRFAHTHRICPSHPQLKLVKQLETAEEIRLRFYKNAENLSEDDVKWFEEYLAERERKLRQVLVERRKNVEDSQEKDCTKSDQEINIPQQIQQKLQNRRTNFNDGLLLWAFIQDVHEKGENSKALFEKSCNSVIVQNWSDSFV
ncbi:uncharacterized protein LOC129972732 [Argiope bruennichi]|uniref:uncharacterized protein LOC129972732 n=1 Tax=Argiope bruennichi TaxID=94029 RepID=UPI00249444F2|nr:uncharacterized protein LOC129972732 [Argiope bruennichi]